jgi:UDP-2,4-diacetamido-2,4,6-trideoxy-beta-L-altropyranose hydrolase
MRCLTLADGLKQRGARTRFVSRHLPAHLGELLGAGGHELAGLDGGPSEPTGDDNPHASWLGASQRQDAEQTREALSDHTWEWIVVDHYALDRAWEWAMRRQVDKIAVIDDIADRAHACDLLLDQNFHPDGNSRYLGKVSKHCHMLLGPRYALLREEFLRARGTLSRRGRAVERILVFFGGVDSANYSGRSIEAIAGLGVSELHVDVVVGSGHPYRDQIAAACARFGYACHVQSSRMAELMASADLGLGAGGSTTWERCCLGLPTLAFCVAENQRHQLAAAARGGLLYSPDLAEDDWIPGVRRHILALMENSSLREAMSHRGMDTVDGRGAARVIDALGCNNLEIDVAELDDMRRVFEWRNDPAVRAVSRSAEPLDWDAHRKWFASVLESPDRALLIGRVGQSPVGVVRFDLRDGEAEVSIYLVPGAHSPGLGRSLLLRAERWLAVNRAAVKRIRAEVLAGNERSARMFIGAGYHADATSYLKTPGLQ